MAIENNPPADGDFYDNDFIGVQAFLDRHSTADWSDYCLSYRFTSRDFNDGVVGLAYVGPQPDVNAAGGCVCVCVWLLCGTKGVLRWREGMQLPYMGVYTLHRRRNAGGY